MNYTLPAIEEYDKLLPVARKIYEHINTLSWQMLLPLFLVSVLMSYSTDLGFTGSILVRLKRLVLVALLLVAFPTIAEFSQILGVELARSIDNMGGIDQALDAAGKKAGTISIDLQTILTFSSDILLNILVHLSFIILVVARFFLLAFQHFYWFMLVSLGPFLILGALFDSASGMMKNLFKNMLQVSAWPILWSILSAFLKALPFVQAYNGPGSLITVITLNLIIAVALLFSPFLVGQLCEGVNLSIGEHLKRGALKAAAMAHPKGAVVAKVIEAKSKGQQAYQAAKAKFTPRRDKFC